MEFLAATQSTWFLIGPIAKVLGYLMDGIFIVINAIGLPNIGLAIFLFTIILKALMIPSSIKQQKSAKLQQYMAPELKAIQEKYKGKNDNASLLAQREETSAVYAKYGTSAAGGCLQLLIQLPVMFALYQVILKLPGYITQIKEWFQQIVTKLPAGYAENAELINFIKDSKFADVEKIAESDTMIDFMYSMSPEKWTKFNEIVNTPGVTEAYNNVRTHIETATHFLGIDLTMTPTEQLSQAWWVLAIPILAGLLQWLTTKLTQTPSTNNNGKDDNPLGGSMKTMNIIFPIMTVIFCFTFNAGIGVYWVASAAVQLVIQLIVNAYMNKVDLNAMIAKNVEKANKKRIKKGQKPIKATNIYLASKTIEEEKARLEAEKQALKGQQQASSDYYAATTKAKKGSLAEKAGMVQQYEEKQKELKSGKSNANKNAE